MVGVPALWELLHRRIKNRLYEQSDWIGKSADLLIQGNAWLRDKTAVNLGQILFTRFTKGWAAASAISSAAARRSAKKCRTIFAGWASRFLKAMA